MTDDKKPAEAPEPEGALAAELSALEAEAAPDQTTIEGDIKRGDAVADVKAEYYGLLKMVLTPLPALLCPNWAIQPQEVEVLSTAYAEACAKTWPDGIGQMGPWAGAALTTLALLAPRLGIPPRNKPQKTPPAPSLEPKEVAGEGGDHAGAEH